jgi:hypothetical protein
MEASRPSSAAVAEKGRVRVYLEFLQGVHRLVAERGHRMQFWGDIIIEQPGICPSCRPTPSPSRLRSRPPFSTTRGVADSG